MVRDISIETLVLDQLPSIETLRAAVETRPDDPEARYALALAYEARGDHREMVRQFLQVRMLDAALDRAEGVGGPADLDLIEEHVLATLARLPEPFKSKLEQVPIVLEPRPSIAMVREGFRSACARRVRRAALF